MIKRYALIAASLGSAMLLGWGGCGMNLFGDKTFLYTSILNELFFS